MVICSYEVSLSVIFSSKSTEMLTPVCLATSLILLDPPKLSLRLMGPNSASLLISNLSLGQTKLRLTSYEHMTTYGVQSKIEKEKSVKIVIYITMGMYKMCTLKEICGLTTLEFRITKVSKYIS